MTYPAVIFWIILVWALLSKRPIMYGLFFVSWSLGTLAVVPTALVGGVSLTPAWITTLAMTAKTALDVGPSQYAAACVDFRRFGLWTVCTIYASLTAFFLPRFFEGQTDVIMMRLIAGSEKMPLAFSTANVTQSLYFILTSFAVVNIYFAARDIKNRRDLMSAFMLGAVVAVATGLIDLLSVKVGASGLLLPYRNASYSLMVDDSVGNMKRVVGLMSEASAYAGLCISFLAPLILMPWGRVDSGGAFLRLPIAGLLALCVYLSTSSGGYVALAGVMAVMVLSIGMGAFFGRKSAWWAVFAGLVGCSAVVGTVLFAPEVTDSLGRLINSVVLTKQSSSSYIERSEWNHVALKALVDTHGMGVGLGSARASSWVVAVLSNLGLIGSALFGLFMASLYFGEVKNPADRRLAMEAKLAILPNILVMALSGTSVGFGLNVAWLFGLLAAVNWRARATGRHPPRTLAPDHVEAAMGV